MIGWPWLLLAFGMGICVGALITLLAMIDLKLRCDDARDHGHRF